MRRVGRLLGQGLFAVCLTLPARQALAGSCSGGACSFTPIKPSSSCGTYQAPPYEFRARGAIGEWDVQELNDPFNNGGSTSNYANANSSAVYFVGNGWTYRARLGFPEFWVDPSDRVTFGGNTFSGLGLSPFHAIWSAPTSPSTSTIHSKGPATMAFESDRAETSAAGFLVNYLGLCKRTAQTLVDTGNPVLMDSVSRYTGALFGTNDVVYLRAPPPAAGLKNTYVLWSEHSPNDVTVDFDIYSRCGAWPTPTVYDYRSFSSNTREFINDASSCQSSVYIAVHSFKGSGAFHLTHGRHLNGFERVIRAGTSFNANILDIQAMETALQAAARRFYGQTEGNWMMKEIWLYNSNSCSNCGGVACDLCMRSEAGRSFNPACNQQSTIYRNGWDPYTISHEWGHQHLCVGDEYDTSAAFGEAKCGHSNMGNSGKEMSGFNNFCTSWDHNYDPTGSQGPSPLGAVWDTGQGLLNGSEFTYDNFNYHDHDMELKVGKVVRK